MVFFGQFLKNPLDTGSITPSGKKLAALITDMAELPTRRSIVELGSGTGVFTEQIIRKMSPEVLFFCLEINEHFVYQTQQNCPEAIVYHAPAEHIQRYLGKHWHTHSDCIISGLPRMTFDHEEQIALLDHISGALEAGGVFLTFTYAQSIFLPWGKRFRQLLSETFSQIDQSDIIRNNIPPAFVYRCTK